MKVKKTAQENHLSSTTRGHVVPILSFLLGKIVTSFSSTGSCSYYIMPTPISFNGVSSDPSALTLSLGCPEFQNMFRISALASITADSSVGSTSMLFAYKTLIQVLISRDATGHKISVYKTDEPVTTLLFIQPLAKVGWDFFVFLQINQTEAHFALRSSKNYALEFHKKWKKSFGKPFKFFSGSNHQLYIGKNEFNSVRSFKGVLKELSIYCHPIPYENIETYKIFSSLRAPVLVAAYLLDENLAEHPNYAGSDKQPYVRSGSSFNPDSADIFHNTAENRLEFRYRTRGTIIQINFDDFEVPNFKTITAVIRMRFLKFPRFGFYEPFFRFRNDKRVRIRVNHAGEFMVGESDLNFTRPALKVEAEKWYFIKLTYTRFNLDNRVHDCSIGISVLGVGEVGGDFACRAAPPESGRVFSIIEAYMNDGFQTDDQMIIEASTLYFFKGEPNLKDTTKESSCLAFPPGKAPCLVSVTNINQETCLSCKQEGSIKWVIDNSVPAKLSCSSEISTALFRNKESFYWNNLYTKCRQIEFFDGSSCASCHSSCISCSGPSSSQCLSCRHGSNKVLDSANKCSGTCSTSSSQFKRFNSCLNCPGGCSSCNNGRCSTLSCSGTETPFEADNKCCDISKNNFFSGGTCQGCSAGCSTCYGPSPSECISCLAGFALNPQNSECIASCDSHNGKFYDGSQCMDCPTGCKRCVDGSTCYVCDASAGYVLKDDYSCMQCDTQNGKFINYKNNPPTCGSCEDNCLECENEQKCTKCNKNLGFYLSSEDCFSCPINNRKFIPLSGDACISCNDAHCLECSSADTCTKCDASLNHYVNIGSCALCPVTNGKFLDTGKTPPTCESCETNCLECSDVSTCTKCNPATNHYLSSGDCLLCPTTQGKFLNQANSPPTCDSCPPHCLQCSHSSTCSLCDLSSHFYLSSPSSLCLFCDPSASKYIQSSSTPHSCHSCLPNCKSCSDGVTCTECLPNHIKSEDSTTCTFCDPLGNFIDTSTTPHQCRPCPTGCRTCSDSTTCIQCDSSNNYFLKAGQCSICNVTSKTQVLTSSPIQACVDCDSKCLTCEETPQNCLTKPVPTCGGGCQSCSKTSPTICDVCEADKCHSVNGVCEGCPKIELSPIQNTTALTWSMTRIELNNLTDYKLVFSEQKIFLKQFDLSQLDKQIKVKIENYEKEGNFTTRIYFDSKHKEIRVQFNFLKTLKKTVITTTITDYKKIMEKTGRILKNSEFSFNFQGIFVGDDSLSRAQTFMETPPFLNHQ